MRWNVAQLGQQFAHKIRQQLGWVQLVENDGQRTRRHRHGVVVIVNQRAPVLNGYLDMLGFQFSAILVAQDGQQKLVAHGRLERLPIDVEILGVLRGMAILQHVLPPDGVVAHPHMVGDDIQQQTQPLPLQLRRESGKAFRSAQLWIEAVVARHVIAVRAVRAGFKDGRGVEVADAQLLEVAGNGLGVGKREVFVHLHPIGRNRNPGVGVQHPIDAFLHVVGGFLARVGLYRGLAQARLCSLGRVAGDGHYALDAPSGSPGLAVWPAKFQPAALRIRAQHRKWSTETLL